MPTELTAEQAAAVLRELAQVHPSNDARREACEWGARQLEAIDDGVAEQNDWELEVKRLREFLDERNSAISSLKRTLEEHKQTIAQLEGAAAAYQGEAVVSKDAYKRLMAERDAEFKNNELRIAERDKLREEAAQARAARGIAQDMYAKAVEERDELQRQVNRMSTALTVSQSEFLSAAEERDRIQAEVEKLKQGRMAELKAPKLDMESALKSEVARLERERHELIDERDMDWRKALSDHLPIAISCEWGPNAVARAIERLAGPRVTDPRTDLGRVCDAFCVDRTTSLDDIVDRAHNCIHGWRACGDALNRVRGMVNLPASANHDDIQDIEEALVQYCADVRNAAISGPLHEKWLTVEALEEQNAALLELAADSADLEEQNAALLGDLAVMEEERLKNLDCICEVAAERDQARRDFPPCDRRHVERRKVKDEHQSDTYKIRIGTGEPAFCDTCGQRVWKPGDKTEAYAHCSRYDDGSFGAIFLSLEALRNGELASVGFAMLGQIISIAVQFGVPIEKIVEKLKHQHDECAGYLMVEENGKLVAHPQVKRVTGFVDAVARVIERAAGLTPAPAPPAEEVQS